MPDENKYKALREAGYRIPVLCYICRNRNFPTPGSPWGTCKAIKYNHLKHTGAEREASIHRYSTCAHPDIDTAEAARQAFGSHAEFFGQKEP